MNERMGICGGEIINREPQKIGICGGSISQPISLPGLFHLFSLSQLWPIRSKKRKVSDPSNYVNVSN